METFLDGVIIIILGLLLLVVGMLIIDTVRDSYRCAVCNRLESEHHDLLAHKFQKRVDA